MIPFPHCQNWLLIFPFKLIISSYDNTAAVDNALSFTFRDMKVTVTCWNSALVLCYYYCSWGGLLACHRRCKKNPSFLLEYDEALSPTMQLILKIERMVTIWLWLARDELLSGNRTNPAGQRWPTQNHQFADCHFSLSLMKYSCLSSPLCKHYWFLV